jgi:hypothetical protein
MALAAERQPDPPVCSAGTAANDSEGGDMKGDRVVKRWRIALFAGLALACGAAVRADSVVTGTLGFTCDGGCQPPMGSEYNTAPTSGSFTYDKATQQFLSFSINWDGWTWTEPLSQLTQADYLAFIGKSLFAEHYFIGCIAGTIAPWPQFSCDQTSWFETWRAGHNMGPFGGGDGYASITPGPSTYPIDTASGTMFVTDLDKADKADPVATPEPGTIVLGGSTLLLLLANSLGIRKPQNSR